MHTGTVKWFSNAKGYGFIISDNVEGKVFAHFSAVQSDGFKSLRAGQPVHFELHDSPKGMHAINISPAH